MKKRVLVTLLAIVMVLTLAVGCGGGQTGGGGGQTDSGGGETPVTDSETSGGDTASAPQQGDLVPVTFVMPRSKEVLEDTQVYASNKFGYAADAGFYLDVQQAFGTTDAKMVATGAADFAQPSPSFALACIAEDMPVKMIFQNCGINIFGFAVRSDSDIKGWQDIKGRTIALGDAAWQNIMAPDLVAAGLDPNKDVEWVVAAENRFIQVAEGKVDAVMTWNVEMAELLGLGFDFVFHSADPIRPACSNAVMTNLDTIKNDPERVQAFVKAWAMGLYFVHLNPEAAADIALSTFPAIDISWEGAVAVQRGILEQVIGPDPANYQKFMNPWGFFFEDKWDLNLDAAIEAGIIPERIPHDRLYTNEFVLKGMNDQDKARVEEDAKNYVFTVRDKYQ